MMLAAVLIISAHRCLFNQQTGFEVLFFKELYNTVCAKEVKTPQQQKQQQREEEEGEQYILNIRVQ
jgi:hypothetical protein